MEKSKKIKIYLGLIYSIIILVFFWFFFNNFSISEITSYEFIKGNKDIILKYKESNIYYTTIIFFFIVVLLNLLLFPITLPTLVIGFIFGKWLGTAILVLGNTFGSALLYILANTFFSEFIQKKFATKFSKHVELFNRNELLYFMFFRFIGGGGIPFSIQNILPVIYNMSIKNYIIATFIGMIPTTFVSAALASGVENFIDQNIEFNFFLALSSPEIYFPIFGFFVLLLLSFIVKKFFFTK
tara:strand:- start:724 stop:1446 length:723 start_codon:yes stop_codon:yes gene_type:complete